VNIGIDQATLNRTSNHTAPVPLRQADLRDRADVMLELTDVDRRADDLLSDG
jgi:hypothetical protein